MTDLGVGKGERRDEVDRIGDVARLLGGQLPVTQSAAARAPAGEVVGERREAALGQRARVDKRHLLLDVEPRAGDDDAALALAERSGFANEGSGERHAVAGEKHGELMQHICVLLVSC